MLHFPLTAMLALQAAAVAMATSVSTVADLSALGFVTMVMIEEDDVFTADTRQLGRREAGALKPARLSPVCRSVPSMHCFTSSVQRHCGC